MSKTNTKSPPLTNFVALGELAEVMTLAETAAYLRILPDQVLQLVLEEDLPGRRIGDDFRFLKTAIQDWLRASKESKRQEFWETHFGALKNDPFLEEMLKDIYQHRGRPEIEE